MLKALCIFTASMCALAVSGQSFIQESMTRQFSRNYMDSTYINRGLASLMPVVAEEAAIQLDSIVMEDYDKTTETWIRTGKYKMGYENSDTASYFNIYLWNGTTQNWNIYPKDIKRFDANGNLIYHIVMSGNIHGETFKYYYKAEYFYSYSNEGHTERIVTYQQDYLSKEFIFQGEEQIAFDKNGKQTFTQTSLWNKEQSKWQANNKVEMEYNEHGHQTSNARYIWADFSNGWYGMDKKTIVFDAEGNELQQIISWWNGEIGKWMPNQKTEFSNHINKIPRVQINFFWDNETDKWKQRSKEEKELNSTGDATFIGMYEWDATLNDWLPIRKVNYEFNNNSQMTLAVGYQWNKTDSTWQNSAKTVTDFNENGKMLFWAEYTWDETLKDWVGLQKKVNVYDENGNQILSSNFSWNTERKEWKYDTHISKTEYEYNPDLNENSTINYAYNMMDSSWIKISKEVVAKKNNDKYILNASYTWNEENEDWNLNYKYEWATDEQGRSILYTKFDSYGIPDFLAGSKDENEYSDDGRYRSNSQYNWDNALQKWIGLVKMSYQFLDSTHLDTFIRFDWDFESDEWIAESREIYFYTQTATDFEKQMPKPAINVFPNPTHDFVTFDFEKQSETAKLELYDLNGKKKLDQQISSGEKISINQLKSGIYLWKIIQGQYHFKGKIVVQ